MSAVGLAACGIIAPIIYIITVLIGGQARADYSHRARAIAELTERDAPNKKWLDGAFFLYHLFQILGAAGILVAVKDFGGYWYSGSALLVSQAVIAVVLLCF